MKTYSYKPKNREKSRVSKSGKFWCWHCDHDLVGKGEKCPTCGKRDESKKLKKYYIE